MVGEMKQEKLVSSELKTVVKTSDEGHTLETVSPYAGYFTNINLFYTTFSWNIIYPIIPQIYMNCLTWFLSDPFKLY